MPSRARRGLASARREILLNADFLAIIERHGAAGPDWGWVACHLTATDEQGVIVGILPLYVRFNSHGDFIHDWSWASVYQQLGHAYFPKLLSGLPHTPATGPRLLVAEGTNAPAIRRALIDGAQAVASGHKMSSWHVAFPNEDDRKALQAAGMLISHNVQFQWLNNGCGDFDGYLATFAAEKRRKVRAERRKVAASGLSIEVCHGDAIDPAEWPALHALYASTFEKFNNLAVFSAACFADLAQALGRRMVVLSLAMVTSQWPYRSVSAAMTRCMAVTGAAVGTITACISSSVSIRASPTACGKACNASSRGPVENIRWRAGSRQPW
jgi:predicted N-acyltransferase